MAGAAHERCPAVVSEQESESGRNRSWRQRRQERSGGGAVRSEQREPRSGSRRQVRLNLSGRLDPVHERRCLERAPERPRAEVRDRGSEEVDAAGDDPSVRPPNAFVSTPVTAIEHTIVSDVELISTAMARPRMTSGEPRWTSSWLHTIAAPFPSVAIAISGAAAQTVGAADAASAPTPHQPEPLPDRAVSARASRAQTARAGCLRSGRLPSRRRARRSRGSRSRASPWRRTPRRR